MNDFIAKTPTLDASWRAVVLFGRNVASYKFALAKTLLDLADRDDDRVGLDELAAPFAKHLCEHLAWVDKQTTSSSSKFLDACRAFNRSEPSRGPPGRYNHKARIFNNVTMGSTSLDQGLCRSGSLLTNAAVVVRRRSA
jgi:hypothetical protein